jgi:hypothetical protein
MLLSAQMLKNVYGVNQFDLTTVVEFTKGDVVDVYFQLMDMSVNTSLCGYNPPGRRYMPDAGATLSVVLEDIDDAVKVTKTATQPFAQDPSIWKISLAATDLIQGAPNLRLTLTEGTDLTRGVSKNAFRIWPQGNL